MVLFRESIDTVSPLFADFYLRYHYVLKWMLMDDPKLEQVFLLLIGHFACLTVSQLSEVQKIHLVDLLSIEHFGWLTEWKIQKMYQNNRIQWRLPLLNLLNNQNRYPNRHPFLQLQISILECKFCLIL